MTDAVDERKRLTRDIVPGKRHIVLHHLALRTSGPVPDGEGRVHVDGGAGQGRVVEWDRAGAAV